MTLSSVGELGAAPYIAPTDARRLEIQIIEQRFAPTAAAPVDVRFVGKVALALLCLKLIIVFFDPHMRLFMGDSASYLASAIQDTSPPDRSFTYPMLIGMTAGVSGSITTLLLLQTLFGVGTASLICAIANKIFGVRRWIAVAAALALALDPSQLFYERMIMTESVSTFVLTASLAAAFAYLHTGKLPYLLGCIALGVVLASLRVGLVPVALALGTVTVLLRTPLEARDFRRWVVHLLVAVVATWGSHDAYKHWYASRAGGEPAYIRDAGIFRLGLVAPLVKAADFEGTGVDPAVLGEITIPLTNSQLREHQIWLPGGLIDVLHRHAGDGARAAAAMIADRVIRNNPMGVVRLGLETELEYFDIPRRQDRLWSDLGSGQLPDDRTIELLRTHFRYDAAGIARMPSPVWSYFAFGAPWLVACLFLLVPLAISVLALCRRKYKKAAVLLLLLSIGFIVGHTICSHIISFRYLHPFPVLVIACIASLAEVLAVLASRVPIHWRNRSTVNPLRS